MKGQAWKFGDDIDTDIIIPGRYLIYIDEETLAKHCMEGLDPNFNEKVNKGDFIVGGKNFGCGSSREHAPIAIKGNGIAAVIAESFARIFYRNATNVGVPLLEAPGISEFIENEDEIEVERLTSPAPISPVCPPRQGPQHGADTKAPASTKILIKPSSRAFM